MASIQYRFAAEADIASLAAMNYRLIQDERHRTSLQISELEHRMRNWLAAEYAAVLFNYRDINAGYALFKPDGDFTVYLRQFYVERELRRKRIGSQAIDWLLKNPWREAKRIRLDVLIENVSGIEFWHAIGFRDYCLTMEKEIHS